MRLASVTANGRHHIAQLDGDRLLVGRSSSLTDLVRNGGDLKSEVFSEAGADSITFNPPLRPEVLLCCGQNYSDHLAEQGRAARAEPEFFVKAGQTIASPDAPCLLDPRVTTKLDYETELAVVVGRELRRASPEEAAASIFGYLVLNDLSARDRQVKGERMALGPGKNFDGATRLGKFVVTADEIADAQGLHISTTVNGELRQSNTTANMIYGCAEIVSFFSSSLTLRPGTIIATGTPGGTGLGCDAVLGGKGLTPDGCVPARYLEPGDVVVSEIELVGQLSFQVSRADAESREEINQWRT
jgi:2-keto-4-pentenoate hydratase/2-oxohepta-3-ene-1,7-dioic acid hydratase in catechol pathway